MGGCGAKVKGDACCSEVDCRQADDFSSESSVRDTLGRSLSLMSEVALEISWRRVRLISDTWGSISNFYAVEDKKLGEGAFGYVCKATSHETGRIRAVKSLSKATAKDTRKRYRQEILIMKLTDHPNIINLIETFEDKNHVLLVMELCLGGDLGKRLKSVGRLKEYEAAVVMQQILRPVLYLHVKRICHRDLKPENFLFLSQEPIVHNTLKITDFGFSCTYKRNQAMSTKLGTPLYSSPQVIAGQYDESCDLWSCGVIMYVLLAGKPPFQGKTDAEVMDRVKRGNYTFKGSVWQSVSDSAKDLVRKLLKYQSQDRVTAEEALWHYFIQSIPLEAYENRLLLTPALIMDLRSFCSQSLLRRAALQVVAQQLSQDETECFRLAFQALDSRGAGILTVSELKESINRGELMEIAPLLQEVVFDLDAGSAAEISFTDFLAATLEAKHYFKEGSLQAAFRAFDLNGDGHVSLQEVEDVLLGSGGQAADLPEKTTPMMPAFKAGPEDFEKVSAVFADADLNGDGVLDFEEFKLMLRGDKIGTL